MKKTDRNIRKDIKFQSETNENPGLTSDSHPHILQKRLCTCCNEEKLLKEFSQKKNGLYGKNSNCKVCVKRKSELRKEHTRTLLKDNKLPEVKICRKCNVEKKSSEFAQDITKSDGLYSSCKSCNEVYIKRYRTENLEKIAESKKKTISKNLEYYTKYKNSLYIDNKAELNKRGKEYYEQNKETIKQKNRVVRLENRKKQLEEYENIESKKCKRCLADKPRENFKKSKSGKFGLSDICKSCRNQSLIEKQEKNKIKSKEYYKKNKETLLTKGYLAKVKRLKTDPEFKLKELLSHRVRRAIYDQRGVKSVRTLELLGCTIAKARVHIEKRFIEGMSWENHGINGWHIDHIIPCSSFDLTKDEDQRKCFHYSNLQPLWAFENLSKGNKST